MKIKKITAIALTAALSFTLVTPAFADAEADASAAVPPIHMNQQESASYFRVHGTVQEVNVEESFIRVANEQTDLILHVSEGTYLMDGQSGTPVTLAEIKEGAEVSAAYAPEVTMSEPGQSNAVAVILCGDVTPVYGMIEDVTANEDGSLRLVTENGGMWVTVAADATVQPFRTRNIVTLDDLTVGAEVVLYYDIVALSYPGQANTDRVVLLAPGEEAAQPTERDDTMVALRDALKDTSLALTWDGATQTVTISADGIAASVVIGSDQYIVGEQTMELPAAQLNDGRTYVPHSFVDALLNALYGEAE